MAIFPRKPRRPPGRPATAHDPEVQSPPAARPPGMGEALRDRLRDIAADAVAPEDALEPALHAILEATRAQAGALCLYDQRHGILRLVTESGLSEEGCRRLRHVRRTDPTAWDMPLNGLLNRRAYLIESASRNRYVPRLVEHSAAVRTIACLPLHAGPTPVGSLVLVAIAPRSFGERDVRTLERPLGELASMIEAVRRRGGEEPEEATPARVVAPTATVPLEPPAPLPVVAHLTELQAEREQLRGEVAVRSAEREQLRGEVAARSAERAVLAAELAARSGETDRLRAALELAAADRGRLAADFEQARRDAERAEVLAASLAAAERERARLAAALETAAAERAERARAEAVLETERNAAARATARALAELESVRRSAAANDAGGAARAAELAAEVERLRVRAEEAELAATRTRAQLHERERAQAELASELRAATAREQRLREELETASARDRLHGEEATHDARERARAAEEALAGATAEVASLREGLASAQAIALALEDEAGRASAEIERLVAAARAAGAEQDRLEIALGEGRARELAATARLGELTREMERLRDEIGRAAGTGRERDAELGALVARMESLAAERDRLRESLEATEAERDRLAADAAAAAATDGHLREALARERDERAHLTGALGQAQAALGELQANVARRDAEAKEQAADIERLRGERDQLVASLAAARAATPPPARAATPPPPPAAPAPPRAPAREPVRVVTVTPPAAARTRVRGAETGRRPIVVVDVNGVWSQRALEGHQVEVVAPEDDLAEQLAELSAARIVINLLAPGALGALAAARAAGCTARFWGCLADPGIDRALMLGMVEAAATPLDPDGVVETLGRYAVRGTRVVTVGTDVDSLMSLRQALARGGLSVSMAWDAKQTADLLQVVRPEVVVVDLALPRNDGYGIVARLAALDPPPSAILVPGPDDAAAAFAEVLADPAYSGALLRLSQLLAAVVARSEAPPVERRNKIRVMGRK